MAPGGFALISSAVAPAARCFRAMATPIARRACVATVQTGLLMASSAVLHAQSLLERPPNVSGNWTGAPGTLYFHFLHRFATSSAPERKVTNVPTFLLASGLPKRTMLGFNYSTNSTLAPRFPNEWELFARWLPLSQDHGSPVDVGGQLGFNNASDGIDGELSVARRMGRIRVLGAGRALTNPIDDGEMRFAVGAGAAVRVGTYVALAGDISTLTDRDTSERVAWSAGVHFAIPLTPHTFSLQATNTLVTTLQGISRGSQDVRYGFEFTIPLTLRRYFGQRAEPVSPASTAPSAADDQRDQPRVFRSGMRNTAYTNTRIEVTLGTTVQWTNNDALPHTVTATDSSFDSGLIAAGKSWQYTFTKAGTYNFYCMPHPFMKGVVVVKAP